MPTLRAPLLAVLVALVAACDVPAPYEHEPTNPYDPDFRGDRFISAPDSVWLADATPHAFTVAWSDPSSFESGFEVEDGLGWTVRLGPDVTRYVFGPDGPCGIRLGEEPTVRVRTIDARGRRSTSPALRVRLPNVETQDLVRLRDASLDARGTVAYGRSRADRDAWVRAVDLATGQETILTGYGGVAATLPGGGALLTDGARGLAEVDGAAVARTVTLADPGGPLRLGEPGGAVVDAAGQTLAGSWDDAGTRRVAVWDLATGALVADAVGGLGGVTALGLAPGGVAVVWDRLGTGGLGGEGPYTVSAVDLASGATRWTRALRLFTDRVPVPILTADGDRVVLQTPDRFLVVGAGDGETRQSLPRPGLSVALAEADGRLLVLDDGFYRQIALASGACEGVRYGVPYSVFDLTPEVDPRASPVALRDGRVLRLLDGRTLQAVDPSQPWVGAEADG